MFCADVTTTYAQTNNPDELKNTINENYENFTQFIEDKEPAKLAETLYTEDAKFYTPNGMKAEGTEDITNAFKGMIGAGLIIEPEAQEVEIFGKHAYEYGIGSVYNREGKKIREERYVCIWKNLNNEWKIYRDIVQGVELR
jgi:ketosteroid isomerase-like protein